MKKLLDKLFDTAHGTLPFVVWLADFLLMCVSLLVIVTIPFYWDALVKQYGVDLPSNVFACALCTLFGSILGVLVLDDADYRRRY